MIDEIDIRQQEINRLNEEVTTLKSELAAMRVALEFISKTPCQKDHLHVRIAREELEKLSTPEVK